MADATATIEGRMRPQRERRAPAKFRDFELSRIGSKTETLVIRVNNFRRSLKEKRIDSYTKISSCTSDGVSREIIPVEQPNQHACIQSECAQRSRLGFLRRSKRISKANSTDVVSSEIIPVDQPKIKCTRRSRSGSHRQPKRISKANSTKPILPKQLSNFLFDHYFQNMWSESSEERREMCTFLTCFSFEWYVGKHSRERALVWIKNKNIFSKKYVFVPILLWSHWSLLIFCHLGESLDSKTITPCMLLLDSLQSHSSISELEPIIRRFVLEIFETKGRPVSNGMVENLPLLVPKVPQQKNFTDCGLFVLYYINLFLERAPEYLSISDGYPYFMTENWFTRKDLEIFYNKLEAFGPEFQIEIDEESSDVSGSGIRCLGTTYPDSE